jgi:hypothetical protein
MAFKIGGAHRGEDVGAAHAIEHGSHGGLLATVLSGFALVISGLSYYESTMKSAELAVYVPPMIHYGRDGDNDVFNLPITISNDGARNGTVLNMELEVENVRPDAPKKKARFHSAFIGEYPRDDKTISRSFAPLSIAGHGTFTETVRFYPMEANTLPYVVDDKGDYRFTLTVMTAKAESPGLLEAALRTDPKPLTFELRLPYLSHQHLAFRNGTTAMYNKNWSSAASTNTAPAVSRKIDESASKSKSKEPAAPDASPEQKPDSGEDAPAPNR